MVSHNLSQIYKLYPCSKILSVCVVLYEPDIISIITCISGITDLPKLDIIIHLNYHHTLQVNVYWNILVIKHNFYDKIAESGKYFSDI